MAHFAKLDENLMVCDVVVVANESILDENGIESEKLGVEFLRNLFNEPNSVWKKTSYNTVGGVYYNTETGEPDSDQSKAFRKNYASIGFTYDPQRDAFLPWKPYDSWVLNEKTCLWEAPVPYPDDGDEYYWDEESKTWNSEPDYIVN